jgi:hypothetical protein
MYKINNVILQMVKTWTFEGEFTGDSRDGLICMELKSADDRYHLITDRDTLSSLELVS